MAWRTRSRRGRRTGHAHGGSPGTWEAPSPSRKFPAGVPGDQLQALGRRIRRTRERNVDATGIPPSEGNEARRDGRWGVGAPQMYRGRGGTDPRDPAEGRRCRAMRPLEGTMPGTPSPDPISTRRQRIAELARQSPQAAFTTLAHHIDIDWMFEAYRRTRKDGAVGVDGQTAEDYAADLEGNLRSLLDRAKSGRYQAPPVRRVHIPKGTGPETRPIGIPTFEDKILQRAVAMVLEPVYEQDFLDGSYGFRPGRSAHQALEALRQRSMEVRGGWVLEVDIRKFFDTLDHRHLHAILRRRVRDGVLGVPIATEKKTTIF